VGAFLGDASPAAFANVVEHLLALPQYGERWGRHWLDVARYSDTKGEIKRQRDTPLYPFAWTYRDYVIQALNADKPFDRFILEQIAADKLPLPKDSPVLAALGFLTLGERFQNKENDIINDRIDVVTKGFLGLTVTCARCHDHMFDPIPTKDYYSLRGIFASSHEPKFLPLIGGDPTHDPDYADYYTQRTNLQYQLDGLVPNFRKGDAQKRRELQRQRVQLQNRIEALELTHPGAPPRAHVLVDNEQPKDSPVFIRGEAENKGEIAPRRFLECLSGPYRKPFSLGSGRLELANAIASKSNPLTARVLVNRVWQHHFGEGLVGTPDDFGAMGAMPTHPALLDYLAGSFMEHGWSIKQLHRLIVGSRTYQQASDNNPGARMCAGSSSSHCAIRCSPSGGNSTPTSTASPCPWRWPRAETPGPPSCWSPAICPATSATPPVAPSTATSTAAICRRCSTTSTSPTRTWKPDAVMKPPSRNRPCT